MQKIHDKYYIKTANEIRIQYYISQPFLTHLTKLSFTDFFFLNISFKYFSQLLSFCACWNFTQIACTSLSLAWPKLDSY